MTKKEKRYNIPKSLYAPLFIIALACLAPHGFAQDIYIKHSAPQEGEKPQIYIQRESSGITSAPKSSGQINYKDRLSTTQHQKYARESMKMLEDWKKSGRTPKTAEEIRAFADASRAPGQSQMYKRKEALIAYLEKEERAREKSDAATKTERKTKNQNTPRLRPQENMSSPLPTSHKKLIYRKPEDSARSRKVFTGP